MIPPKKHQLLIIDNLSYPYPMTMWLKGLVGVGEGYKRGRRREEKEKGEEKGELKCFLYK